MIYPIVKYGNPVLEQPTEIVTEFDTPELNKLLDDMFESMYAARGVGLAAPQIGIGRRITVIDTSAGEDPSQKLVLINPQILKKEGTQIIEEGCLSIPGIYRDVKRPDSIRVCYQDCSFHTIEKELHGIQARIFQHEYDHLEGILFIDRLNPLERKLLAGKLRKIKR